MAETTSNRPERITVLHDPVVVCTTPRHVSIQIEVGSYPGVVNVPRVVRVVRGAVEDALLELDKEMTDGRDDQSDQAEGV